MKFNPTWPQVAFFFVLVGGPILAYAVAPGAAVAVTGMATTALGFLFGNAGNNSKEKGDPQ